MLRRLGGHILIGFVIILFQALVFDNMFISQLHIIPFVFIIFILLLPFDTPNWALLIIAFLSGLILDIFNDTGGIYIGAILFSAFIRPSVLNSLAPYDGYELSSLPRLSFYGWRWLIKYTLIISLSYNLAFYFLDSFSFHFILQDLLKTLIGTIYTTILILITEWAFFRK